MPMPNDPHPVPGSTGEPVFKGHLFWKRIVGWKCGMCKGFGRVNHQCGMGACCDDPCPRCKATGVLPLAFRQSDS